MYHSTPSSALTEVLKPLNQSVVKILLRARQMENFEIIFFHKIFSNF